MEKALSYLEEQNQIFPLAAAQYTELREALVKRSVYPLEH